MRNESLPANFAYHVMELSIGLSPAPDAAKSIFHFLSFFVASMTDSDGHLTEDQINYCFAHFL